MNEALKRLVWDRAQSTCEYCRLPQSLDVLPFQIDHIIAEQHGGSATIANLNDGSGVEASIVLALASRSTTAAVSHDHLTL